ncbi:MAG: hypothetical protein A2W31_18180 [Planctomycetes bacterium RBG_16_64_10]|nr:MAG: hypothetical protein A2W31_18180 [Planctomycetes bacterium RBG_16_64_10]
MTGEAFESEPRTAAPGRPARRRLRHFPTVLVALALVALAAMWCTPWLDRDARNFITVPLLAGTVLLLGGWFLFCSGVAWRRRLVIVGGALSIVALLAVSFRLGGYTGDMRPKIVLRWTPKPDQRLSLPASQSAPRAGGTVVADLTQTTPYDYPQFLGPARLPILSNVTLAPDWKAQRPKLLWRQPIGGGWSAFAVVGQYAVTQEQRGDLEMVVCYEAQTGRVVWSHADAGRFSSVLGGDGPRATPTVYDGKIYVQSPRGALTCLDGADGSVVWSHDLLDEHGTHNLQWGRSGSPLVVDDLVIVSAGGTAGRSLVAYQAQRGILAWSAGNDVSSYSSPALATLCGIRQVVVVNQDWVVGHRLSDGQPLWRETWPGNSGSNASASQPVAVGGDRLFLSKGYGIGCELLTLSSDGTDALAAHVLWQRPMLMRTKLTNVVLRDDHVYGLSQGVLECVELARGRRRWKQGRYGHGQILLVGDLILIMAETGEVALVEASPAQYRELGRFQALDGKTWNNPALAGPYLLVRNAEEAACYQLPLSRPVIGVGQAEMRGDQPGS